MYIVHAKHYNLDYGSLCRENVLKIHSSIELSLLDMLPFTSPIVGAICNRWVCWRGWSCMKGRHKWERKGEKKYLNYYFKLKRFNDLKKVSYNRRH